MKTNVILTRIQEENSILAAKISILGFNPISSPMLSYEIIDSDFSNFSNYTDIIITSKFAAKIISRRYMNNVKAWVVGEESAALLQTNDHIDIMGVYKNVENMVLSLPNFTDGKAIYFSGDHITQEIPFIDRYVVYNTVYSKKLTDETLEITQQNKAHFIMIYSSNNGQNFMNLVKNYNLLQNIQNSVVIAISDEVGKILKPYVRNTLFPQYPSSEEMIKLLRSE